MKKWIAMLLCLLLALSLWGCGPKVPDEIVGTWRADMDLAQFMGQGSPDPVEGYILPDGLKVSFILELKSNGTYTLRMDPAALEALLDAVVQGAETVMEQQAAARGTTVEALLEQTGYSSVREMLEDAGALDSFGALSVQRETADYTWKNNTLTIGGREIPATVNGDELTLEIDGVAVIFKRS